MKRDGITSLHGIHVFLVFFFCCREAFVEIALRRTNSAIWTKCVAVDYIASGDQGNVSLRGRRGKHAHVMPSARMTATRVGGVLENVLKV